MKTKSMKIPSILLAVGILVAVAVHLLTSMYMAPVITEQDFAYTVTYTLDGETKTYDGVFTCRFDGFDGGNIAPLDRYYEGVYTADGQPTSAHSYTIAQKDGYELYVVTLLNESYLMGDTKNESYSPLEAPFLEAEDAQGNQYGEDELPDVFDAAIVDWDYPEPIDNSFRFAGFSGLHPVGMFAMTLVGLLTILACVIFVKKADGVSYGVLDILGIILNFAAAIVALPIILVVSWLIQAFPTSADWIYQAYLCVPPIIAFTLAASVALRRKGYRVSGFLVQFFGFAVEFVLIVLEYVL